MSPLTGVPSRKRFASSLPVFDSQHEQIGVVVVGISLKKVEDQIARGRLTPSGPYYSVY